MNNEESPAYLRLRSTIAAAILGGAYGDGDPLPSVRALAAEHGLNPLTVAKAYQSFQEDGLVVVRRGIGMFVGKGATARLRESERNLFLTRDWPCIVRHIRDLGLDPRELLENETA